jgi:hypothetical protein
MSKESDFIRFFGSEARVRWIKSQPCVACGAVPSENAHVIHTRGSRLGRPEHIVPLCHTHHREQENTGTYTFAFRHGLNFQELAKHFAARWEEQAHLHPKQLDLDF